MLFFALILGIVLFVFFEAVYFRGLFTCENSSISSTDDYNLNQEIEVLDVNK